MQMAENHMKRCSNSTGVREMKIKVAMRYYRLPIRPASTNVEIKINAVGMGKQVRSPTGNENDHCSSLETSIKIKNTIPFSSALFPLGICY